MIAQIAPMAGPGTAALRRELRDRVRQALDLLDNADREVILMRHFEEMSNEEVAEALHRALAMPIEEQRERMLSLRQLVREFNVYRWAGRMLLEAARVRQRERISARIGETQGVT